MSFSQYVMGHAFFLLMSTFNSIVLLQMAGQG